MKSLLINSIRYTLGLPILVVVSASMALMIAIELVVWGLDEDTRCDIHIFLNMWKPLRFI